jgi:predicted DsbA family dithiol-disulfide isomerase
MNALPTKILKIEMVHDIVCSWCPVSYNNIRTAIDNLGIEVEFRFLPFELNREMGESGESIASYFNRHFGWDERKLLDYQKSLVATAAHSGVSIDFSKRKYYYNTRNAHLLMHWAERFNKQIILNEHLIIAYFKDGRDISDLTVLLNIAEEIGLDRQETNAALTSTQVNQQFDKKVTRHKVINLRSIPAFIINETELISGSSSIEFFEKTLSQFIDKRALKHKLAI